MLTVSKENQNVISVEYALQLGKKESIESDYLASGALISDSFHERWIVQMYHLPYRNAVKLSTLIWFDNVSNCPHAHAKEYDHFQFFTLFVFLWRSIQCPR